MAIWPTQMWQSILNRAVAILGSGPFAKNFGSLSAAIF
uniref:Transposase n=1 Tax=Angiostrongylus cantonensis TaxID=6313 RepID=A0A0K0D041_ANGCA